MRITGSAHAGSGELAVIGWRLRALVRSRPTAAVLELRVAALAERVGQVLTQEIRKRPVEHVWSSRAVR